MTSEADNESFFPRTWNSFRDATATCCESLGNFCSRSWDFLIDIWIDTRDWLQDNVCVCCSSSNANKTGGLTSPLPNRSIKNYRLQKSRMPDNRENLRQPTIVTKTNLPASQAYHPTSNLQRQPAETIPNNQPVPNAVKSSLSMLPLIKSSDNQQELQQKNVAKQQSHVEPPRIDFVETGSIFGDRKRVIDNNMLLLENGRFKSPGQPKVMQGPGGRTIRLTFHTGFPAIKSIESRGSLSPFLSKPASKRSFESISSEQQAAIKNLRGGGIDATKFKKRWTQRMKSMKSLKSYKSVMSQGSKEVETENLDNNLNNNGENDPSPDNNQIL